MTVAELILKLQQFPPDAVAVILDADEGCHLEIQDIGVDRRTERVELWGDYGGRLL